MDPHGVVDSFRAQGLNAQPAKRLQQIVQNRFAATDEAGREAAPERPTSALQHSLPGHIVLPLSRTVEAVSVALDGETPSLIALDNEIDTVSTALDLRLNAIRFDRAENLAGEESYVVLLREVLAAGRSALEPPLSRSVWKRGVEAGLIATPFVADASDDEAVMQRSHFHWVLFSLFVMDSVGRCGDQGSGRVRRPLAVAPFEC